MSSRRTRDSIDRAGQGNGPLWERLKSFAQMRLGPHWDEFRFQAQDKFHYLKRAQKAAMQRRCVTAFVTL